MSLLYRHYKNKPYLLHRTVIHSETLEEYELYECLYENPTGKHWIRPKKMFHESIEVNGQLQPRFAKVEVSYSEHETLSSSEKELICEFFQSQPIFNDFDRKKFLYQLETKSRVYCVLAKVGEKIVGLKLGYVLTPYKFYSWMGGVAPEYRKGGIASQMMEIQHRWCKKQNFLLIETRTRNQFPQMIALNLKFGFQIVGTKMDDKGEPKILLEKKL